MTESVHEQQNKEIHKIELRLERIEIQLGERNRKSDEMLDTIKKIDQRMDNIMSTIPREYVTVREFTAYQESIKGLLAARMDGNKSWQSWIMLLVPSFISVIISIYAFTGGAK